MHSTTSPIPLIDTFPDDHDLSPLVNSTSTESESIPVDSFFRNLIVTNSSVSATYATKTEISGFKNIVQCTDAEYAALVQAGTVDANTVYLTYTASA